MYYTKIIFININIYKYNFSIIHIYYENSNKFTL